MARCDRHLKLIVVGSLRDKLCKMRCDEFLRRLGSYGKCDVVELPDSDVVGEGKAILKELEKEHNSRIIVLSEEGEEVTSRELSRRLGAMECKGVFVIGGPFGLAPEVKARASWLWSLSKLTFTHEFARLLLTEQLYRAMNILNGGSYHHD